MERQPQRTSPVIGSRGFDVMFSARSGGRVVVFVLATVVALAVVLGVGSPAAAAPSSVVLTASPSPSRLNQAVTFTATVTSGGVAVTTGTVTFQRGATILAADVAVDAQGRASFTKSDLVYAVHVITATYNGAPGFDPSTSARLLHLVDPFAPVARPTLSPAPNAAGWNNRNVSVDWRWLEHHSGLDPANCTARTISAGEGELTLTATCADLVGNQGTASQTVRVDLTAPTVTITSPTPGGLPQGATVIADYACADVVSGVVSCTGPVDDGAPIDTSTPGVHQFTVTGCDVAGNQGAASVVYQVDGVVGGGVNVAPVLTQPTCQPLGYGEGAPPTVIAPEFTAADVDGTNLVGATVEIGAGYVAGQDVLSLGTNPQNGISAAFDPATGTLTLTGTATVANYQTALRDVRFANDSPDATAGTRTISFRVDDGPGPNDLSNTVTRNVVVTALNDAPTITLSGSTPTFTENGPAVTVDGGLTVTDVDDTSLVSGRVSITAGVVTGDTLTFTSAGGITDTNPAPGVLALTGTTTVANWQSVLRSVQFSTASDNPTGGDAHGQLHRQRRRRLQQHRRQAGHRGAGQRRPRPHPARHHRARLHRGRPGHRDRPQHHRRRRRQHQLRRRHDRHRHRLRQRAGRAQLGHQPAERHHRRRLRRHQRDADAHRHQHGRQLPGRVARRPLRQHQPGPHRRDPHHQLPGRRRARPQRPVQRRHPRRHRHPGQRPARRR